MAVFVHDNFNGYVEWEFREGVVDNREFQLGRCFWLESSELFYRFLWFAKYFEMKLYKSELLNCRRIC